MNIETSIDPVAECSILIKFNSEPCDHLSWVIGQISQHLSNQLGPWVMNVTPSFTTILIDYLPHRISIFEFVPYLEHLVTQALSELPDHHSSTMIELPVFYDITVGPDLDLYQQQGIDIKTVIEAHHDQIYTVGAIGFTAGFAFLTNVDDRIRLPRKASPRVALPKGSVGIANNQTAIYPCESPGGWNIIGNCPIDLYHPDTSPILPFSIGCQVKFYPIGLEEFKQLGGQVSEGWQ
ncbi:KipI [Vibrio orientalis CIP 102891 = ATCC 33934]|uniref:Allophanate hydrolase subunit 1 n=1 Tax=Vibrio orientalis CIP 102891 = ATCC 33934 TaxID=675816 RepID=C9QFH8_VIBOR|nr:carboxyltransferase domain-containing protein [Vibrio orientalis]EEX94014.1 allophanate hydrolase subunit 1 [Vibrio orientalis CIP 102891 = ATCC 33934]EGU52844.1 KipI [Vibrio orientalis CIP 102891 = ATCC 33934]